MFRPRRRKSVAILAVATAAALVAGLCATTPALADSLTFQVTNYDNDGTHGVYLRNSSNVNDVNRDAAHYVTYGTSVELICGLTGSAVGPKNNTAWDYVRMLAGSNSGRTGYLSEHWINTPVGPNQHVAGEPSCSGGPPAPVSAVAQKAISWATSELGSTAWDGACLSFVRNAYANAGINLRSEVSVSWGSSTYPQDIWGHFTKGSTGTGTPPAGALVFYLASGGRSKTYSHVTIAVDGSGNTISSTDRVNESTVHRESISQHSSSGAYNTYTGWWLP